MNLIASLGFSASFEVGLHGVGTNKKGPTEGACFIWLRGQDLNL